MVDWDDKTILRLRELWDEGHSTAEIGRRMGMSKCAVIGKAHRLDLPARPSPIRRNPNAVRKPPGRPRAPARTLPTLDKPAALKAMPPTKAPPTSPIKTCLWPIGEPGTKGFRFCDDVTMPGKPYCAEHTQLAYVKIKKTAELDDDADRLERRLA